MAQRGGKRPGAGKPKGYKAPHTLEASIAKQTIVELVSGRVHELIEKLFERALNDNGDVAAIKELLDRAYGKPSQSVEMSGKDGNPFEITILTTEERDHLYKLVRNDKPESTG